MGSKVKGVVLHPVQVKAALTIYIRRLTSLAEESEKIGELTTAAAIRTHLAQAEDFRDKGAPEDSEDLSGIQREMLRKAVNLLIRNLKAAAGTVLALGREEWATMLTDEADVCQSHLLPALEEQRDLTAQHHDD